VLGIARGKVCKRLDDPVCNLGFAFINWELLKRRGKDRISASDKFRNKYRGCDLFVRGFKVKDNDV